MTTHGYMTINRRHSLRITPGSLSRRLRKNVVSMLLAHAKAATGDIKRRPSEPLESLMYAIRVCLTQEDLLLC